MSKERTELHGDEDQIEIELAREDLPDEDEMLELVNDKLNRKEKENENYKKVSN